MQKIFSSILVSLFVISNLYSQNVNMINGSGQKTGKWIKKFENGKTKYEGQFENGIPTGTFTYYFNTGEKRAENVFSNKGKIADNTTFYKSGNKMAEGRYIDQKKVGLWKYFLDEEGEKLVSTEKYKNGVLNGECITYYPDSSNAAEIVYYKNGLKEGKLLKYFPDGQIMTESHYHNNQLVGEFIHYHPNGQIQIKGLYDNGIQSGEWKYYDEEGNELDEEEFKATETEIENHEENPDN